MPSRWTLVVDRTNTPRTRQPRPRDSSTITGLPQDSNLDRTDRVSDLCVFCVFYWSRHDASHPGVGPWCQYRQSLRQLRARNTARIRNPRDCIRDGLCRVWRSSGCARTDFTQALAEADMAPVTSFGRKDQTHADAKSSTLFTHSDAQSRLRDVDVVCRLTGCNRRRGTGTLTYFAIDSSLCPGWVCLCL